MNERALRGALIIAAALVGAKLATSGSVTGRASSGAAPPFLDRRVNARLTEGAAKWTRKRRPDEKVTGVVLHQMGFSRGSDPTRYDAVTAHYKVLPDGTIVWSHDHSTRLPAANGFNGYTVSVEFAGNLPKREGSRDPRDFWKPEKMGMNNLTDPQVHSGRWLLRYLRDRYGIRNVFAHLQSEEGKPMDPGPAIWRRIAEYAKRSLGYSDGGRGYYIKGGAPIPDVWRGGTYA